MNDDTIADLKQFIATTVSQEVSDVRSDISGIRSDIKNLDNKLSSKIDDLSASVAEALDNSDKVTDARLKDHNKRIVRLERKAA